MCELSVQSAIQKLIMKRHSQGTVSTASIIRELRQDFPYLPEQDRELANAIARQAIQNGLQVHFEADLPRQAVS